MIRTRFSVQSTSVRSFLRSLSLVLVFVLLWYASTKFFFSQARLFPAPADVWDALVDILGGEGGTQSTYAATFATLKRLTIAFGISFVVGCVVGVVAGRRPLFFEFVSTPMWVGMAVPSIVWVFVFVVILGTGDTVPILALSILLAPNIAVPVAEGSKAISRHLSEMATAYHATPYQTVTQVYIPQLVPYFASAARVAFSLGVKVVVIAEVVGIEHGIGYELNFWFTAIQMAPVAAWGIILMTFGVMVDKLLFSPLERRAKRWQVA